MSVAYLDCTFLPNKLKAVKARRDGRYCWAEGELSPVAVSNLTKTNKNIYNRNLSLDTRSSLRESTTPLAGGGEKCLQNKLNLKRSQQQKSGTSIKAKRVPCCLRQRSLAELLTSRAVYTTNLSPTTRNMFVRLWNPFRKALFRADTRARKGFSLWR